MAKTGATGIKFADGEPVKFDVYFPESIQGGKIDIVNSQGITVDSIDVDGQSKGTVSFNWDGIDKSGNLFKDGDYKINITYTSSSGESKSAEYGVYPIEAVRFDGGEAEFKLGQSYIPLSSIKEIYNPKEG